MIEELELEESKIESPTNQNLRAPFPWFGGKSGVASVVWGRFGDVANYIEPFAGSLAVLLARPTPPRTETVNDMDCYLCNFWRAISVDPSLVAYWADYPVSELDQNARHLWLVSNSELRERMNTDPDYYDAKAAGWWVWGQNVWIGTGWCDERFWRNGGNVSSQLPHLSSGRGIHRQLPHLGSKGTGVNKNLKSDDVMNPIEAWCIALAERLRRVRIACGNWDRVLSPAVTTSHGMTGVFLDPPYLTARNQTYSTETETDVAIKVREWAIANGQDPLFRIALCGYAGEHEMPKDWTVHEWKARKGYQKVKDDGSHSGDNERIWFSPHCYKQSVFATPALSF